MTPTLTPAGEAPPGPSSRPALQVATPAAWRFQPYYGRRVSDGPVRNRYGSLFVPVSGQQIGSQSVVMTIGFKGQVDDWWFAISDDDARLVEAAPAMRDALQAMVALWDDISDRDTPARHLAPAALTAARSALALAQGAAPAGVEG